MKGLKLLSLVGLILLAGCGKKNEDLLGGSSVQSYLLVAYKYQNQSEIATNESSSTVTQFRSDGTFTYVHLTYKSSETGTWSKDGEELVMNWKSGTTRSKILEQSNSSLKLDATNESPPGVEYRVYKEISSEEFGALMTKYSITL